MLAFEPNIWNFFVFRNCPLYLLFPPFLFLSEASKENGHLSFHDIKEREIPIYFVRLFSPSSTDGCINRNVFKSVHKIDGT